jgi:hypothetical protein
MGFWSSVGSFCKSVVSTVSNTVSSVVSFAKEKVSSAIGWMADKAESFVGKVKEVWQNIKPYIQKLKPFIKPIVTAVTIAAAGVATFLGQPVLAGKIVTLGLKVATYLEKAVDWIVKIDQTPFMKKLNEGINWAIKTAKNLKASATTVEESEAEIYTEEEHKAALNRKAIFREAESKELPIEIQKSVAIANFINSLGLVRADIQSIFQTDGIKDFEHYLRLRASQKLLANAEKLLTETNDVENITEDDIFIVNISSEMMGSNPILKPDDALRLDEIIFKRFNKKILPFVFEEMIISWEERRLTLEKDWGVLNKTLSKDTVLFKRLNKTKDIEVLSEEEQIIYSELEKTVPLNKEKLNLLGETELGMKNYVFAAEGFLQVLEKTPQQLIDDEQEYLCEFAPKVGMIIIDCAQNNKPFNQLQTEDRDLITNFANIFIEDSKKRNEIFKDKYLVDAIGVSA